MSAIAHLCPTVFPDSCRLQSAIPKNHNNSTRLICLTIINSDQMNYYSFLETAEMC